MMNIFGEDGSMLWFGGGLFIYGELGACVWWMVEMWVMGVGCWFGRGLDDECWVLIW